MKIKFLVTLIFTLGILVSHAQIGDLLKEANDDAGASLEDRVDAIFEGRPTTPGADIASDKENLPVKKEKFTGKLERYKNEGFKVAVVLLTPPTNMAFTSSTSSDSKPISVGGSIPLNKEDFLPIFEAFYQKLTEAFGADGFEIVDMKTIPYKGEGLARVDDWAATKYRMIVSYNITSQYTYLKTGIMTGEPAYEASYYAGANVVISEYVNEKKGVKIRYPVRQANLAYYRPKTYKTGEDPEISSVEGLQDVVGPLKDADLAAHLKNIQEEQIVKFIEKRKKK